MHRINVNYYYLEYKFLTSNILEHDNIQFCIYIFAFHKWSASQKCINSYIRYLCDTYRVNSKKRSHYAVVGKTALIRI
jgi:hypothetical protein